LEPAPDERWEDAAMVAATRAEAVVAPCAINDAVLPVVRVGIEVMAVSSVNRGRA
jgi:hypothetical protein